MDSPTSTVDPTPTKEIETEIPDLIRVYKDGTVERIFASPFVPSSSLPDPTTQVSFKDITISLNPSISARLYLPNLAQSNPHHKLPILVYFHGGGFCIESAFDFLRHRYLTFIASKCNVLAVSIEYRLAPEHPLPAAYEDSWESLKWVSSHAHATTSSNSNEPWLIQHGDYKRVYIGGDSAGGNIVHNIAMRCGVEELPGGVKLLGAFLSCPYFWGSKPVGKEPKEGHEESWLGLLWNLVYPSAVGGVDNPAINPMVEGAPSLAGLGCEKLFVVYCDKDLLRERDVLYCEAVKKSGFKGEVEWLEVEGENHCFDIFTPETDNATKIFDRLVSFLV